MDDDQNLNLDEFQTMYCAECQIEQVEEDDQISVTEEEFGLFLDDYCDDCDKTNAQYFYFYDQDRDGLLSLAEF